ncbi:hypothetical protein [Micromonospora zamorensis]|uniref:hypothetical protein n=1 Tax=Micromonospora zamorensis TaxID=709883 RepID=UPI00379018F1
MTGAAEDSHDPMAAHTRGDVEAGRAEPLGHHLCGPLLLARGFRVPMDVTAQLDQVTVQPRGHGVHRILAQQASSRPVAGVRRLGRRQPGSRHTDGSATKHSASTDNAS